MNIFQPICLSQNKAHGSKKLKKQNKETSEGASLYKTEMLLQRSKYSTFQKYIIGCANLYSRMDMFPDYKIPLILFSITKKNCSVYFDKYI